MINAMVVLKGARMSAYYLTLEEALLWSPNTRAFA